MMLPLIAAPGVPELLLILLVLVLLFGAKKLPELARGSGRALRIFKAETKGLMDELCSGKVVSKQPAARASKKYSVRDDLRDADVERLPFFRSEAIEEFRQQIW